ncbi:MAG: ABC transporter ATP-binding protein [Candidatus Methylomirabilia bacterium]
MLDVRGIHVFYGDLCAVEGVSLEIPGGSLISLVGGNGAGKTTTLNAISGILRPTRGEIHFDGVRLDRLEPHMIVDLGVVQVPEGRKLFPSMTVHENLELGAYRPRAKTRQAQTQELVFSLFPVLQERRRQTAGTLSGGEQQMLAIGRALMSDPRILLLDEPSLGLAPRLVQEMFEAVRAINQQGITIVLVEQNVSHALAVATGAYVMENGRIVLRGGPELKDDPRIRTAYLGV